MTSRPRPSERTNSVSRSSFSLRMAPVRIVHGCAPCEHSRRLRLAWRPQRAGDMATSAPIDLHYRMDGPPDAAALVLSHALGLSMAMWDPQMAGLSRAFRVVRYDHRGHGGSPVPAGPYTIEELGRDLIHLLDRLGLDRVSFCGLSLGGMVGMWVASNAPERIDH